MDDFEGTVRAVRLLWCAGCGYAHLWCRPDASAVCEHVVEVVARGWDRYAVTRGTEDGTHGPTTESEDPMAKHDGDAQPEQRPKTWRKLGSGEYHKWSEGDVIEGIWRGTEDGKYGLLGSVEQPDGVRIRFSMSAVLTDRLAAVTEGAEVRLTYLGMGQTKAGAQLKRFEVEVAEDEG